MFHPDMSDESSDAELKNSSLITDLKSLAGDFIFGRDQKAAHYIWQYEQLFK